MEATLILGKCTTCVPSAKMKSSFAGGPETALRHGWQPALGFRPRRPPPPSSVSARSRRLLAPELVQRALRLCALALQPSVLRRQIPGVQAVTLYVAGKGILPAGQLAQTLEGIQL